jgi:hypothetical protein
MRTRTGCPPSKFVASRCWFISLSLSHPESGTTHLSDMVKMWFQVCDVW